MIWHKRCYVLFSIIMIYQERNDEILNFIILHSSLHLKHKCLQCTAKANELALLFQYFWRGLRSDTHSITRTNFKIKTGCIFTFRMLNNLTPTFRQTSWKSFEILIYIQLCLELIVCTTGTSSICLIQVEASLINSLWTCPLWELVHRN